MNETGTEELGHQEMVSTIVRQLTRNMSDDQIERSGFGAYFVDHTAGVFPASAGGVPFTTANIGIVGDPIADLNEDLAAELQSHKDNILPKSQDKSFPKLRKHRK